MSADENRYLFLDFETTGVSPIFDSVVEVGAILTDSEFVEIARFESLVSPSSFGWAQMGPGSVVGRMHTESGLLQALAGGGADLPSTGDVQRELLALIDGHASGSVVLAGSGVGAFDLQFIRFQMPKLAERLEYFPYDVGVLRREWRAANGVDLVDANEHKPHRAMADVELHLLEARAFRTALRVVSSNKTLA
jgi:oligoribonuclease